MIKSLIKLGLARLGYTVINNSKISLPSDPDSKVAAGLANSECYKVFQTICPIFQPWLGYGDFKSFFEGVSERTLVSADRCYLLWKFAKHCHTLDGDFIECGVFRGGTALLLARSLPESGKKLWLFDSFEGLSARSHEHGDFYEGGTFNETSLGAVSQLLAPYAQKTELRKGWIPDTFTGLEHLRFSFAHVDVDIHKPALACCEFIYPRLVTGGVMLFDDYGFPACRGERTAVDQFFSDKGQPTIVLPSGQALVIKT